MPILYFSGNRIFPKSKFQILAESISTFSSDFDPIFWFCRVYIQIFSSHLAKYPKILFARFFFNLIQNEDFGRRKIWILKRKSRFRGFRGWRFQIFRSRNKIREKMEKPILDFWKWIWIHDAKSQIRNRNNGFGVWNLDFGWHCSNRKFWKFLIYRNFKFWQNSCPMSSSNFQNFDEIYDFYGL